MRFDHRRAFNWIAVVAMLSCAPFAKAQKVDLKYSFAPNAVSGFTQVKPGDVYSPERGYGFDLESRVKAVSTRGAGYTTGELPKGFFFSAKVPEGAYLVTVTLGDPAGESTTTVKSETRRLHVESLHTAAGKLETRSFLVHVRRPDYPEGTVAFKDRERLPILYVQWNDNDKTLVPFTELDWDEKLTLAFTDGKPALVSVEITTAPEHVTIYLVGDSTMTDQMMDPIAAWGQMFPRFFKPPVLIANYAECGESAASFFGEKRWPKLMSEIHAGDYVLIQFGINDIRLPEPQIRQYFGQFITDTRAKGAIPVLATSQNLERSQIGTYADVMRQIAREQNAPLLDLNASSATLYPTYAPDVLHSTFFMDGTHHRDYGAYELAKCVVQLCIDAKLPFANYVVDDWKTFDPAHPDPLDVIKFPLDPQLDPARPGGPGTPDRRGMMAGNPPAARGAGGPRRGGPGTQPATQPIGQ